jgi:hypothetical protein
MAEGWSPPTCRTQGLSASTAHAATCSMWRCPASRRKINTRLVDGLMIGARAAVAGPCSRSGTQMTLTPSARSMARARTVSGSPPMMTTCSPCKRSHASSHAASLLGWVQAVHCRFRRRRFRPCMDLQPSSLSQVRSLLRGMGAWGSAACRTCTRASTAFAPACRSAADAHPCARSLAAHIRRAPANGMSAGSVRLCQSPRTQPRSSCVAAKPSPAGGRATHALSFSHSPAVPCEDGFPSTVRIVALTGVPHNENTSVGARDGAIAMPCLAIK